MRYVSAKHIQECPEEFAVLNIQYGISVIPPLKLMPVCVLARWDNEANMQLGNT